MPCSQVLTLSITAHWMGACPTMDGVMRWDWQQAHALRAMATLRARLFATPRTAHLAARPDRARVHVQQGTAVRTVLLHQLFAHDQLQLVTTSQMQWRNPCLFVALPFTVSFAMHQAATRALQLFRLVLMLVRTQCQVAHLQSPPHQHLHPAVRQHLHHHQAPLPLPPLRPRLK